MGCAVGPGAAAAQSWAEGPARWLLLPDERRAVEAIRARPELDAFRIAFWAARDPEPATVENEAQELFGERTEAADRLYGQGRTRGSVTDRGGALILLGPPSILRYSRRKVPRVGLRRGDRPGRPTDWVSVEGWVYRREDLAAPLAARLAVADQLELVLVFLAEGEGYRLRDGREVLAWGAEAWIPETPPPPR